MGKICLFNPLRRSHSLTAFHISPPLFKAHVLNLKWLKSQSRCLLFIGVRQKLIPIRVGPLSDWSCVNLPLTLVFNHIFMWLIFRWPNSNWNEIWPNTNYLGDLNFVRFRFWWLALQMTYRCNLKNWVKSMMLAKGEQFDERKFSSRKVEGRLTLTKSYINAQHPIKQLFLL